MGAAVVRIMSRTTVFEIASWLYVHDGLYNNPSMFKRGSVYASATGRDGIRAYK
jgi:hypothetical protein